MKLPQWLHWEYRTPGTPLRTRTWGSRRTILGVMCIDTVGSPGPTIWMISARGWCLTIGPGDGVADGLVAGLESEPRTRHRTWYRANGRAYSLTFTPQPQPPEHPEEGQRDC